MGLRCFCTQAQNKMSNFQKFQIFKKIDTFKNFKKSNFVIKLKLLWECVVFVHRHKTVYTNRLRYIVSFDNRSTKTKLKPFSVKIVTLNKMYTHNFWV